MIADADSRAAERPGLFRWLGQMLAVLALALFWLSVAGYYFKLPTALGVAYAIAVLIIFALVQIAMPWRLGWSLRPLLRRPSAHALGYGAVACLLNFAAGAMWITAFGSSGETSTGTISPAQIYVGVFLFPVIEEVAFRGWLQVTGERRLPPVTTMLLGIILFAALHSGGGWIPRINAGLLLGTALLLTRSLWLAIGMHIFSNLLVVTASQSTWLNDYMAELTKAQPIWLQPSARIINLGIMVAALAIAFSRARTIIR